MSDSDHDPDAWGSEEEEDPEFQKQVSESSIAKVPDFKVISSDMIIQKQEKIIKNVIEVLGICEDDAVTCLKHFVWNSEKLQEKWFDNEEETRKKGGLVPTKNLVSLDMNKPDFGYICYGPLKKDNGDSLNGAHFFGSSCWKEFMMSKLAIGYQGVFSTCPYYEGPLTVTHSIWKKILKNNDLKRYMKFHGKSFTDDAKNIKWCPSPGCSNCIENVSYAVTEVIGEGGNIFGFKCSKDSHRPGKGDLAKKWLAKNQSESENVTWMLANTKDCPNCQRPIEKNQGCNHMTCNVGRHDFGWMCLGPWKEHGSSTGGYYKCNKYEDLKTTENSVSTEEKKREKAKHELKKYMFFYERFDNHNQAGEQAQEMKTRIDDLVDKLNVEKNYPIAELSFLKTALDEVIRGRKVLKWTYAYGFYLENEKEKALFENSQELLEKNTDRLHEYLEQDFTEFLVEEELDKKPFYDFKSNLITGYTATKNFYTNLLDALEDEEGLTKGKY